VRVDYLTARNDDEADRYEAARDEWIAERAAALELQYAADDKKVGEAVADFFLADDETLVPNLTEFLLRGAFVASAWHLHDQLRAGIAPILKEYAEDAARDEWDQLEARELDIAAERRAVA